MNESPRGQSAVTLARIWVRSNIITTVLIVFILLSLLLHALTIGALIRVRSIIDRQLDVSAAELARVRQQRFSYTLPIDQTFTIDTTIAISETVTVPVNLTVPISQTVRLPINTDLGTFDFDVPLNLSVPISDTLEIPLQRDIPFQTDIPVKTDIPIDIGFSDPPLGTILQQLEEALRELRARL